MTWEELIANISSENIIKYKDRLNEQPSSVKFDEMDINIGCDILELLCFIHPDKQILREDFERELEKDVLSNHEQAVVRKIAEQMGFDLPDNQVINEGTADDLGADAPAEFDAIEQFTRYLFSHLSIREKIFGASYPFFISEDRDTITCNKYEDFTKAQKLYLYFLVTSNRSGLTLAAQRKLEFDFEPIAFEAFKAIIPSGGSAHLLGKGQYSDEDFKTKKYDKFKLLSEKIKVNLQPYIDKNHFSPKDTGENGIDFIGWLTFSDNLPNNIVYAGQATCKWQWADKYVDSSLENLGGIIDPSHIGGYINSLFIPYHFAVGNNWAYPDFIVSKKFVLLDRFRILKNINIVNIDDALIPDDLFRAIA